MSKYEIIKEAIKNKYQVHAIYKGKLRKMYPHVIGKKNGREHALFYQFGGESSSGRIVPGSLSNWRCLFISELSEIEVLEGVWHTAQNHSKTNSCVDVIDVEVEY